MNATPDRPPILRVLLLFAALLALSLGLAVCASPAAEDEASDAQPGPTAAEGKSVHVAGH